MGHDAATIAQMRDIHDLFVNHARITRTVTNVPDGIRTVTESDDPRIAQLLKDHVVTMRQRVDVGNDPGLPIESDALHAIFKNYEKIETTVETTEKGMVVVQTSTDPETIAAHQQHASEVTDFVTDGMAAMRTAMMKNASSMVPHGMHGGMMRGGPNARTGPDARQTSASVDVWRYEYDLSIVECAGRRRSRHLRVIACQRAASAAEPDA